MTFRYTVLYYPCRYGIRYTQLPRRGYVRAHSLQKAWIRAREKFGPEIEEVR